MNAAPRPSPGRALSLGPTPSVAPTSAPPLRIALTGRPRPPGADQGLTHPQAYGLADPVRVTTSILVNTHNHAAFIEACIDSLLVQSEPPDEIIVYDDDSADDTLARLRRYGSRIIVLAGGPSSLPAYRRQAAAIQAAFHRSSGSLVFLLDGDDRFKRDKVRRYAAAFAANPDASLLQAPMDKIDEYGRIIGSNREPRKHIVDHLAEIYRRHDVDFFYPTSALAFPRAYLEAVLPLDFSDGLPLWADTRLGIITPYFGRVLTLADSLTEWRRHVGSDSLRVRSRRLQIHQTLMRASVFNQFCRQFGLRTISPWRNRRFYLQLLRYGLPEVAYRMFYQHVRPRLIPAR